jgi:ATP-independent RNA helicase DbpA
MSEFSALPLHPALLEAVTRLGFEQMTPIQAETLPHLLAGRDVIAQARTGSGKTAAFGLGLLSRLSEGNEGIQALVLTPTRELADQVSRDLRRLAQCLPGIKILTLCGGTPLAPQAASLLQPPDIIVGTPGRILDHLGKRTLDLDGLSMLVLDEADRMLDMGFGDDITDIVAKMPRTRQTLLFSATYPDDIRAISGRVQRDPVEIAVQTTHSEENIEQRFYDVAAEHKIEAISHLLRQLQPASALVFCNTRIACREVSKALRSEGFPALALHGELEQRDREEVLVRFGNHSCTVLVATDVAARGLDIKELPVVISHELSPDPDVNVHRVGRTGRAGGSGLALHLCAPEEMQRARQISDTLDRPAQWERFTPTSHMGVPAADARMATLRIDGGRKDKLRPGDILGALTGDAGLAGDAVGRIDIFDTRAYVAIQKGLAGRAMTRLRNGKIKNRRFRIWPVE